MGYQFFLPMVLRWRASRAQASLQITVKLHHKPLRHAENTAVNLTESGRYVMYGDTNRTA